jgi:hypothetical protein
MDGFIASHRHMRKHSNTASTAFLSLLLSAMPSMPFTAESSRTRFLEDTQGSAAISKRKGPGLSQQCRQLEAVQVEVMEVSRDLRPPITSDHCLSVTRCPPEQPDVLCAQIH